MDFLHRSKRIDMAGSMGQRQVSSLTTGLNKYGLTQLSQVLLITTALWRQVDHAVKTLMPWRELQIGPSCADHTLLLDYISPILPVSLFTAIRNRHWAVACSIIGQILLLLTVSTIIALCQKPCHTYYHPPRLSFLPLFLVLKQPKSQRSEPTFD